VDAKRKWDKYTPEYDEDDNEYGTNLTSGWMAKHRWGRIIFS
jgi:hypothetical protein